jgi:hypothetical protein
MAVWLQEAIWDNCCGHGRRLQAHAQGLGLRVEARFPACYEVVVTSPRREYVYCR